MTRSTLLFALALGLAAGCNAIAGISDYTTVDGLEHAGADGGAADGAGDADALTDGDGHVSLSCNDPDVSLRISVIESKSMTFTGITDQGMLFSNELEIGRTFEQCVAKGTALDLRAQPNDPANGMHDWGTCGVGRRCQMTVEGPTALDVHLQ